MFWRFGGYANISTLDSILDKPDVTVEELLDESDLIQELKQQNSKLVEFLREEPVLKSLLNYVVADKPSSAGSDAAGGELPKDDGGSRSPPSALSAGGISFFGKSKTHSRSKSRNQGDGDGETEQERSEARRKKYAYVSCEVLSSEVWSITEALLEHREHLRAFWKYIYRPAPLDALQAGYFTKVNEALLDKKTEDMLAFFQSLDGIVPAMLQHVDCPMVMDLLLKIISLEKHEGGAGIVDWLQSQDLIPLLLGYLSSQHSSATQTSAGDFLKAIITISANATTQDQSVIGPNELTRQLVSENCIKTLIEDMLRGGNPLTVGVGIIIEVIRKNNSDYDSENQVGPEPKTSDPIYLGTLLRQFAINVPNFMHLIRSKSAAKPDLKAAYGGKIEPLGFDRFKTCELMAELLHCSNMGLLNEHGAEDEVCKRDTERNRLKAEGKLATPKVPTSPGADAGLDEFGSSVDSHGFHHAGRPSDDGISEKSDNGRKLEVQNASDEDGFEQVNAPSSDDLPDEVTFDDLDEKGEQEALSSPTDSSSHDSTSPTAASGSDAVVPAPLSPNKLPKANLLHFDPPPKHAADSPTTAGVTDRINDLDVDEDTVMTEFGEEPEQADEDGPSELERELAKFPEDRPAPLFSRKEASAASSESESTQESAETSDEADVDQSVATIQGDGSSAANTERSPYETEADGSPVVGDLLKIQFVEHHVVPTILDFFFRFPWNNFLHNVVYDVVQQVFNGTLDRGYNRTLAFDLFSDVKLREGMSASDLGLVSLKDITQRILDGQRASDASQADRGMRLGYMGHLTLIAEEVCKFGNRHAPEALDPIVHQRVDRDDWVEYVEGTLTETRDRDNAVLGGVRPQDSLGGRSMGLGGGGTGLGFSSNTTSALANAGITPQDSLALSEGGIGQSFEFNSGSMLSGFSAEDDDEDMEDDGTTQADANPAGKSGVAALQQTDRGDSGSHFSEDEQASSRNAAGASISSSSTGTIPPPLSIPPSRARRQLAARLALRTRRAEQEGDEDDFAIDDSGPQLRADADSIPQSRPNTLDSDRRGSSERFSGLFGSGYSSGEDEEDDDESERRFYGMGVGGGTGGVVATSSTSSSDDGLNAVADRDADVERLAGRDISLDRDDEEDDGHVVSRAPGAAKRWTRPPRTMEVSGSRRLLDDEDDDDEADGRGREGRFVGRYEFRTGGDEADEDEESTDSSDEGEMVELRTRRTS